MVVAACGGSGSTSDSTGHGSAASPAATADGAVTTLNVGVIPIVDVAPLYLGIKEGYFAAEHLKIVPKLQAGGSLITTSVVSGTMQIGFSNTTSLVIGAAKGLPIRIIASGVSADSDVDAGYDAVLVRGDSPIRSPQDLAGKNISVNGIQNVGSLTINTALSKAGVDYKSVKYTEVQFPSAIAALKQGQVDAAFVVEPFLSQGLAQGDRAILHPFEQTAPSYTVSNYFTTVKYASAHPDVISRFVKAIDQSLTYAQDHPADVRSILPTYTKVSGSAAAKIYLPQWSPDLKSADVELTAQLASKYGYIAKQPDLSTLIK